MKHEQNLEGEPVDISAELTEAARDENLHRLEDLHQKEAAYCDAMAIETSRRAKASRAYVAASQEAFE